jgi:hypothetical protein
MIFAQLLIAYLTAFITSVVTELPEKSKTFSDIIFTLGVIPAIQIQLLLLAAINPATIVQ